MSSKQKPSPEEIEKGGDTGLAEEIVEQTSKEE